MKIFLSSFLVLMLLAGFARAQDDLSKGIAATKAADYSQALKWFEKAAAANNADAMSNLGILYENGQGVQKNLVQAFSWYKKAAERGNKVSMFNVAAMYGSGEGTAKDLRQSFFWYKKAAESGDAEAMYSTGVMLLNGEGTDRNLSDAGTWFRSALRNGFEKAGAGIHAVGMEYFNQGLAAYQQQDHAAALKSYTAAGEYENLEALHNLATMYYKGEGVTANTTEAKRLFEKAAAGGFELSKQSLEKIRDAEKNTLGAALASKSTTGNKNNTLSANWLSANAKTYLFRSECSRTGKAFIVISRIKADLTKATFEDVKAAVGREFSNNGWAVVASPKYLGTSDEVRLQGTAGRDYVVSDGYVK